MYQSIYNILTCHSDGHSRIVLAKVLTSTYKVRSSLCYFSPALSSLAGNSAFCDPSPRRTYSSKPPSKCLDFETASNSIIWHIQRCLRNDRALSWRSLRVDGYFTVSCGNATNRWSFRRNRAPTIVEVSSHMQLLRIIDQYVFIQVHVNCNGI